MLHLFSHTGVCACFFLLSSLRIFALDYTLESNTLPMRGTYPAHAPIPQITKENANLRTSTYPASFSILSDVSMPATRDQVGNTCWAYATTSALDFARAWKRYNEEGSVVYPSDSLLNPTHLINNRGCLSPDKSGYVRYTTAYLANGFGPVLETDSFVSPCYFTDVRTFPYLIDSIKQAVIDNGNAVLPLNSKLLSAPMRDASSYASYASASEAGDDLPNHIGVIIGWDDNFNDFDNCGSQPALPGAWLMQNTWGTSFDSLGYYHLSYYSSLVGDPTTFSGITARTKSDSILMHDTLGDVMHLKMSSQTNFETITFYPISEDVTITGIGAFVNLSDASTPTSNSFFLYNASENAPSSDLLDSVKNVTMSEGYHRVNCNLSLHKGDTLGLIHQSSGSCFIPVEAYSEESYAFNMTDPNNIQILNGSLLTDYTLCYKIYVRRKSQTTSVKPVTSSSQQSKQLRLFNFGAASIYAITQKDGSTHLNLIK